MLWKWDSTQFMTQRRDIEKAQWGKVVKVKAVKVKSAKVKVGHTVYDSEKRH